MPKKTRKRPSAQEKVAILRRHLIDRVPVSDLCDEYQLQPTLFYPWQKQFFENGAAAFERKNAASEADHLRGPSPRCARSSSARTKSSRN